MEPIFFDSPEAFYEWLEEHHDKETEVWVGYWKKATGKPSLTWSQAVDQALCFGWIDTRSQSIDSERHMQRFTPRKPASNWSRVNIEKVARLTEEGKMRPAGVAAFEKRRPEKSGVYSFERRDEAKLDPEQEKLFRANAKAWEFFQSQPPGYRKTAIHLVISAKKPETRAKRLNQLIADSAAGLRIKQLRPVKAAWRK
jgi:uncharacterized protein YdeI (YjbR/CyaY-like superfamily)